jgi:carbon-monoxide dehydrogenase medium subunit
MTQTPRMYRPTSRDELLSLLGDLGADAKLLAGGTAFTILRKSGLLRPDHVISLLSVPDLAGIERVDGGTRIGALTRLRSVEGSATVREHHPVLAAAVSLVANRRVRNVATMGGNVAEADPTSDPPAVLRALDAVMHLTSKDGDRDVPAGEFFVDYFQTSLREDEIVSHVVVPDLSSWSGTYLKFLSRSAEDRTCIGVAAFVDLGGDTCRGLRLALVGMGPVPLRLPEAEKQVVGGRLEPRVVGELAEAYVAASDPVSDVRGSADYRKSVARTLINDAVARAATGANDGVFA